jgi:uncharacterized membrane protein HdeD (DUF308 family)
LSATARGWNALAMATQVAQRKRSGWVTFAGVVALAAGAYNALGGIAAIADDDTLKAQATKVLYGIDMTVWGWFWLIVGALQILAGILVLRRNEWGMALAVTMAGFSALCTIFVIFVVPLFAITVLALDVLVMYGLLTNWDDAD